MNLKKGQVLAFMWIGIASNFIVLGYFSYDEAEYRNIFLSACFIGVLACVYEAVRLYRKNKNN